MSAKLNEEAQSEFREAFTMHDSNKDGRLESAELAGALRWLGQNPTQADISEILREFGSNGQMTVEGLFNYLGKKVVDDFDEKEIIDAFKVFDKDGKGLVGASDLRHILTNLGERLNEDQVEEMLKQAVGSGDGAINYEPFVRNMLKK
ncbi:MyoD light chain [Heterostelium album PN500]|uniref:MyoD light chain n=1 Tax=Heterostelium pallidum (strain ATCC 26659 / Pp 5 / PN500) TaxID=670386 RepID=D3BNQ2_HETP5|nr:MyoD light chain [Heterostelium album PN500]EFA76821.1 MyoD light chain [Heterostelium album PN500]|eukprot:XP_020428953.1 MyoD light chain [Heterostelium album PN500]